MRFWNHFARFKSGKIEQPSVYLIKQSMERMIPDHVVAELLPRAAEWAQGQEQFLLRNAASLILRPKLKEIALRAGIARTVSGRILGVPAIPLPEEADLRKTAIAYGLITPGTIGLTLGHGIFIRQDCLADAKLIAHELKHVAQYERLGSIPAFLQQYLSEVSQHGYPSAPMELEAIAFAESEFPN